MESNTNISFLIHETSKYLPFESSFLSTKLPKILVTTQKLKIYEFIKIFHSQIFTLYSNNVDNKLYTVMMRTSQLVSTD